MIPLTPATSLAGFVATISGIAASISPLIEGKGLHIMSSIANRLAFEADSRLRPPQLIGYR